MRYSGVQEAILAVMVRGKKYTRTNLNNMIPGFTYRVIINGVDALVKQGVLKSSRAGSKGAYQYELVGDVNKTENFYQMVGKIQQQIKQLQYDVIELEKMHRKEMQEMVDNEDAIRRLNEISRIIDEE